MQIALYDASNIEAFEWQKTPEGLNAKQLLYPMICNRASLFVKNVETKMALLYLDGHLIPLTINEKEYESSYLTSNYYLIAAQLEMLSKNSIKKRMLATSGNLLKGMKINRSVLVNNWLMSTNPWPTLNLAQLEQMTHFLIERFPTHTINLRSLLEEQMLPFKKLGYGVYPAREFYGYDPKWSKTLSSRVRYHKRRDRKLLEKMDYQILRGKQLLGYEKQLAELNRKIYIDKHTKYGPDYTEAFFSAAIESLCVDFLALEREGEIDGFFAVFKKEDKMCIPLFGYKRQEIYRVLIMLVIEESERLNLFLNDGNGGEYTKSQRGMQKVVEYSAIYARHLKPIRRSFWALADYFMTSPVMKR